MHGSPDGSEKSDRNIYERWGIGLLALPILLVLVLSILSIIQPTASNWIAEGVQAEFAGERAVPNETSTLIARPGMHTRTVRAY
jgi:hypothetical protein